MLPAQSGGFLRVEGIDLPGIELVFAQFTLYIASTS